LGKNCGGSLKLVERRWVFR